MENVIQKKVLLLHDEDNPHMALTTQETTTELKFEVLRAYSLDLALCDFHVLGPLKDALWSHHFESDEQL